MGYDAINERLMRIKINSNPCPLNIFLIYAPTTTAEDTLVEQLYQTLETYLQNIPGKEICMIMGDFNAKVGSTVNDDHIRTTVGKFGLGVRNERGERLIQFCIDNKFTIMNTTHKQHNRRLYTWRSPNGLHKNQIDYILIQSRWRSSIHNSKTLPSADCGSDHQLLMSILRIKLKVVTSIKTNNTLNRNVPVEKFNEALSQKLQPINSNNATPEEIWINLKTAIMKASQETTETRKSRKKQPWISDNTLILCETRRKIKNAGLDDPLRLQQYRSLNREVQRECRKDKSRYYEQICRDIELHTNTNQPRDLFQKIKELTRKFKPRSYAVEDAQGYLQTELHQALEVWKDYCEGLYKEDGNMDNGVLDVYVDEPNILQSEVSRAIQSLNNNKSTGQDNIPAEILKLLHENYLPVIHRLCQTIWETAQWPKDWSTSVIIPLHKKGSTKICNNYRLIALISHASKIMLYIIRSRLAHFISHQIAQEQAGFVKHRGTREQILNVRMLIEKAREHYLPMYMCFVDYEKAFDNVQWSKLWSILIEMGTPMHLVALICNLYENSSAKIKIDNTLSSSCKIGRGVRQGCILSPLLYNIYSEHLMRTVLDNWKGGFKINGKEINNLRYADDTLLIANSREEIEELLERLKMVSIEYGLKINYSKSKVMIIDRENEGLVRPFTVGNCEVVNEFVYLGSLLQNNGGNELEIRRRAQLGRTAMSQLTKIWKDRNISLKTKIRLVNSLVFSVFLYASETWTLKMDDRRRIDAYEMWCWRRLLRIPWTAKRTNVSVLKEIKPSHRLSSTVSSNILKFFGHISRHDNMERLIVQGMPEGKRRRGRSPTRWTDIIKLTGSRLKVAAQEAKNRDRWRLTVAQVVRRLDQENG